MSFLKRLFGGGPKAAEAPFQSDPVDHSGFTIRATPYKEDGQYQVCGVVSKEIGGELKEHRFVRADRFPTLDTANEITLSKARQMIDQMGDRIFD